MKLTAVAVLALLVPMAGAHAGEQTLRLAQTTPIPDKIQPPAAAPGSDARPRAATFARLVQETDAFELAMSKLALDKASTALVKQHAELMIRDHSASKAKLEALRKTAPWSIETPSAPATNALSAEAQKTLDELSAASPEAFDRIYVSAQMDVHQRAVDLFKTYAAEGDDPSLKAFAAEMLPLIEKHAEMIKRVPLPT
jgi:putative membrane protein